MKKISRKSALGNSALQPPRQRFRFKKGIKVGRKLPSTTTKFQGISRGRTEPIKRILSVPNSVAKLVDGVCSFNLCSINWTTMPPRLWPIMRSASPMDLRTWRLASTYSWMPRSLNLSELKGSKLSPWPGRSMA